MSQLLLRTILLTFAVAILATGRLSAAPVPKQGGDEKPQAVDRYGDLLPESAIARLGTTRWRQAWNIPHASPQLSMSADGKRIVSVNDGSFIVWEAPSGKSSSPILSEHLFVAAMYTADGKTLLTVECPVVSLLERTPVTLFLKTRDAATSAVLKKQPLKVAEMQPLGRPRTFWFAADGRFVVTRVLGNEQEVYSSATGDRLMSIPKTDFHRASFSDDGKRLAFRDYDAGLHVHDVPQKKELLHFSVPKAERFVSGYGPPTLSFDGKSLFASDRNGLHVWDVDTGMLRHSFGMSSEIVAYAPGGKRFAFVAKEGIRLCDVDSFDTVRSFEKPSSPLASIAFSPDGTKIVSTEENMIGIWDCSTGKQVNRVDSGDGHSATVESIVFTPDSKRIVSGSDDGQAILWDVERQSPVRRFPGHSKSANALAVSPDEKTLATGERSGDGRFGDYEAQIRVWNLADGSMRSRFFGHLRSVDLLEFFPDGKKLASSGSDGRVCIWDPETSKRMILVRTTGGRAKMALAPDGKSMIVASEKKLDIYDVSSGRVLCNLDEIKTDYGLFATVGFGRMPFAIRTEPFSVAGTLTLWDFATARPKRITPLKSVVQDPTSDRWGPAVSPDLKLVATAEKSWGGSMPSILLWDAVTGTLLQKIRCHEGMISALAFSPDGKLLASASQDTTVLVWDVHRLRLMGMWSNLARVGNAGKAASDAMAAIPDESVPFLVERVRQAMKREHPYAATIEMLRSEKPEDQERAAKLLEATPAAEFALRLAEAVETDDEGTKRIHHVLEKLYGAQFNQAADLVSKIGSEKGNRAIDARLRELGPAAVLAIRQERKRLAKSATRPNPAGVPPDLFGEEDMQVLKKLEAEILARTLENPQSTLPAVAVLARIDTPTARNLVQELRNGPAQSVLTQAATPRHDILTVLLCVLAGVAMVITIVKLVQLALSPDAITSKMLRKLWP